jgi:UPF0755 protein
MAKNKANRWLRISMVVIILGSLGVGAYIGYPFYQLYMAGNDKNVNLSADETATIFIATGSDLDQVTSMLSSAGLLKDADAFKKVALKKNYQAKNIVPGKYEIHGGMTNNDLVNHLRAGNGRLEVTLRLDNLYFLEEIAEHASRELEFTKEQFMEYITSDSILAKYGFDKRTIFALFVPDTYKFDWATSPQEFVQRMAKVYKDYWTEERRQKAKEIGLTQTQVATLASVVMLEQGMHREEWPVIAGLYLNRVRKKMKLESDPTVKYALGDMNIQRLYFKDLKVDSQYNTYKYPGIPPSPMIMASKQAMDAVLDADKNNYIFMCAKADGSGYHHFTANEKEHNKYAEAWRKSLDQLGINR